MGFGGEKVRDLLVERLNKLDLDSGCTKARRAALRLLSASVKKVAEVSTYSLAFNPSSTSL